VWGAREEEVKYCDSCGTRLSADNFCPRCGTQRKPYSRTFVSYDQPESNQYGPHYGHSYEPQYTPEYSDYPEDDYYERGPRDEPRGIFGRKKDRVRRKEKVKKPKKGKCKDCGSKNLQFYDDGTGRCPNCGRTFQWSGSTGKRPSRYEKDHDRGRRGHRQSDHYSPQYADQDQEQEFYCPECGLPMRYISEYQQYYCDYCKEYE
jgi:hypothetical protein